MRAVFIHVAAHLVLGGALLLVAATHGIFNLGVVIVVGIHKGG